MNNLQKELRQVMDLSKGKMEASHVIELLTHIAFIAKEAPEKFNNLVNTGQAKQLDLLTEIGESLTAMHPVEVCVAPSHYRVDEKVLNVVITLVSKFSDFKLLARSLRDTTTSSDRRGGELCSNLNMERLFKALIGDCSNKSLYDGACGLARVASSLNAGHLYLEEKSQNTRQTAYRLLTLEGKQFDLECRDSLLDSAFDNTLKANIVVTEPPMGLKFNADIRRQLAEASYLQVPAGKSVSAAAGDSLWIQQALSKLDDKGKAYILLPQGVLFRGGYDAKVREYLLENELLETVIGLPAGILDFASIAPVLLIINKNKPPGSPVTFVDASDIGSKRRSQTVFSEEDSSLIAALTKGKIPEDNRYRSVFIPEIRAQNNELNIARYISKSVEIKELNITHELNKLSILQEDYSESQLKLTSLLHRFR